MKKKFICPICGFVFEGEQAPERCPQCKQLVTWKEPKEGLDFACEHILGVAKDEKDPIIHDGLRSHFMGECTEAGQYLAMARQADREGYPEIAAAFRQYAFEEATHASLIAELLGELVWDTKTNLEKRMMAEAGACEDKLNIARRAKELDLDPIHDSLHEMARDEARHGKGFEGLFKRYFAK